MTGFEAISANDGWAIALLGVSIVFSGLVSLSLIISQLPKVLQLLEKSKEIFQKEKFVISDNYSEQPGCNKIQDDLDINEVIRNFKMLTSWIGEPFPLPKLLTTAQQRGLVRPHSTINTLLKSGYIIPDGKGYFNWNNN